MKTYITSIEATGKLYAGPDIEANSWEEAENYCNKEYLGHITVEGELIMRFDI